MSFLAVIYPVFTLPYLRLWYFPWVIPLALLGEIAVFLMLNPSRGRGPVLLTLFGANIVGLLAGFAVAWIAQLAVQMIMGSAELARATLLLNIGMLLAVVVVGVVKWLVWSMVFGLNVYLRRVVIVGHMLCVGILCLSYLALPYLGSIEMPHIPFL